jgi:hypothetical protein
MKVKDLIEVLKKYNPELPVVVDGYEGGVGKPAGVTEVSLEVDVNTEWYLGEHEIVNNEEYEMTDRAEVRAVYIAR